jgi:hypothetical protein
MMVATWLNALIKCSYYAGHALVKFFKILLIKFIFRRPIFSAYTRQVSYQ